MGHPTKILELMYRGTALPRSDGARLGVGWVVSVIVVTDIGVFLLRSCNHFATLSSVHLQTCSCNWDCGTDWGGGDGCQGELRGHHCQAPHQ